MKSLIPLIVGIGMIVAISGCSGKGNPIGSSTPLADSAENGRNTPARQPSRFRDYDVREIFGPQSVGHNCHGVDSAVIIRSPGAQPEPIYDPESQQYTAVTAFVSLHRHYGDSWIPAYRWITEGGQAATVSDFREVPDDEPQCYNFPKCDAITYWVDDRQIVELAVCYMWRDHHDHDWDVGVTRLRWISAQHGEVTFAHLSEPADEKEEDLWNDDGSVAGWDELHPDMAYDPITTDLYLVFSDYTAGADPESSVRMYYRHFRRDAIQNPWSAAYPCQWSRDANPDELHAHNYWHPRIDIGLVANIFGPGVTKLGLGIAYMSQFHQGTFHVHVFYWSLEDESDGPKYPEYTEPLRNTVRWLCLRNPRYGYQYAGMPYLDIAPSNSSDNYGSIVFAQVVGSDLYANSLEIWEINSLRGCWHRVTTDQQDFADGLYPSIAIHYGGGGGDWHYRASVTYFRQDRSQPDEWYPWVVQLGMDPYYDCPEENDPLPDYSQAILYEVFIQPVELPISGIYNTDQVPFIYPGAASAICTQGSNYYWAAWSGSMHMEPAVNSVYAAWGRATSY